LTSLLQDKKVKIGELVELSIEGGAQNHREKQEGDTNVDVVIKE
jgi:hypothetical protein